MKRQTVSLCLIAKDEEATIGMAIKSVLALVDEVIVVDTGSTDNTKIIAEGYGARVIDISWSDDFSAARNIALGEASCDWVLVLDANEFLQPVRPVEFQRLLHDPGVAGYRLKDQLSQPGQDEEQQVNLRLFRNAPEVRYRYPIFEQLEPSLVLWAGEHNLIITNCDLVVLSDSENSDRATGRRERNLRILRKALETHPNEPYFPYKLACEGISMLDNEVLPVAGINRSLGYLNQAWRKISSLPRDQQVALPWLPDLGIKVASGLLTLNRVDEAQPVIKKVVELFPDHPGVRLQAVVVEIRALESQVHQDPNESRSERIARLTRTLKDLISSADDLAEGPVDKKICKLYPYRYLCELVLLEGNVSEAVGYCEQALSLDPEYSFGWLGMAECSRFAGDRKRALKLYLRTITENQWNHRAWLRGCDLMLEMDFLDNAASWWRRVATYFPEHPEVLAGGIEGLGRGPGLSMKV